MPVCKQPHAATISRMACEKAQALVSRYERHQNTTLRALRKKIDKKNHSGSFALSETVVCLPAVRIVDLAFRKIATDHFVAALRLMTTPI